MQRSVAAAKTKRNETTRQQDKTTRRRRWRERAIFSVTAIKFPGYSSNHRIFHAGMLREPRHLSTHDRVTRVQQLVDAKHTTHRVKNKSGIGAGDSVTVGGSQWCRFVPAQHTFTIQGRRPVHTSKKQQKTTNLPAENIKQRNLAAENIMMMRIGMT